MVKKRRKKKTPKKSKAIKRIGVFVSLFANIENEKKKLDKYIVEQGCQRLGTINIEKSVPVPINEAKIIELYTRVRYVGKKRAKKLKPITPDVIAEELQKMANKLIGFEK